MNFLHKYYKDLPKKSIYDLDYEDQVKVLTFMVAKELPFVWKDLDENRDTKKEATGRSMALNTLGRDGRSAMPKYTEGTFGSMPLEEVGDDILSASLETLNRMLKDIILNGNNVDKARKFANTLETREGCVALFKAQVICSAEIIIDKGVTIRNGAFLEARLRAKEKAKTRISKLYSSFYAEEITWDVLHKSLEEILTGFSREFLMTKDAMSDAVNEQFVYEITEKDSISYFMHAKVDEIREMIKGQKKLFL